MDAAELLPWLQQNRRTQLQALAELDLLQVDELSMIPSDLFEIFVALVAKVNPNLTVVLYGDFHQLPPVRKNLAGGGDADGVPQLCFMTDAWGRKDIKCLVLHQFVRGYDKEMGARLMRVSVGWGQCGGVVGC